MNSVRTELDNLWALEETKARQRSERSIKDGDRNTRYFQMVANQRRKTTIHAMEGPDGVSHDTQGILNIATNYYRELFGAETRLDINISESFFSEGDKVTVGENILLEAPFSEEEVKKAIFESYGFSFMFYQNFWGLIKNDLMKLFSAFHEGSLDIFRINFALITLVPKEEGACSMKKFRPISLLNCSYKIFTKVLTNRINLVADRLVCSNQTAFINGRYILESVVMAHEIIQCSSE